MNDSSQNFTVMSKTPLELLVLWKDVKLIRNGSEIDKKQSFIF